jgi:beta-glucanase (GH16 family)
MTHKSSRRVFLAAAAPICLGTTFADGNAPAFYDSFTGDSLDPGKWMVENRAANGTLPGHSGFFTPENIDCSMGMLRMKLVQRTAAEGLVSYGASIQSTAKFGYGRYQFVMRMASTSASPDGTGKEISGSVSSAYVFVNNSETELDIEYLGDRPGLLHLTNWCNTDPRRHPSGGFEGYNLIRQYEKIPFQGAADRLNTYVIDWTPRSVAWYIEGHVLAVHTAHVPKAPAYIKMNLWGTNSRGWGGLAAVDTTRYLFVRSVSFTPMEVKQ